MEEKGFTLIELLVVIAIIAILTTIVIVAIGPVGRIKDSYDSSVVSNVRSAGTLISTCIIHELTVGANPYDSAHCADTSGPGADLTSYGNIPASSGPGGVTILSNSAGNQICAFADNPSGHGNVRWQSSGGSIEGPTVNPPLTCP